MPDSAAPRYSSKGAAHSVIDPEIAPALSMQSSEAQELVTQPTPLAAPQPGPAA